MIRAQFHGSAYRKHRIGAYGSREFCAYGRRISRISGEFWLLRVRSSVSMVNNSANAPENIARQLSNKSNKNHTHYMT